MIQDLTGLALYHLQFFVDDDQIFSCTSYGAPVLKVGDTVHLVISAPVEYVLRGDFKITDIAHSFERHGASHTIYIEYLVEYLDKKE